MTIRLACVKSRTKRERRQQLYRPSTREVNPAGCRARLSRAAPADLMTVELQARIKSFGSVILPPTLQLIKL